MNKQQAQQIIRDTFENSFDKSGFTGFIKNLLNRIDDAPFTYQGNYIPDAYKQYIKTLERIGKFSDEENSIDILVITLQKETSLERARTMQRNFVAWYLNGSRGGVMEDAALVAYVSPDKEDWRFSLVKMDYKFEQSKSGRMKVKEEFTPARRWSFLVGANEKSHTAQSRLVNILANDEQAPTLKEIENAFDIETVTKEFFLKYRELFLRTKEELDRVVIKDSKVEADFQAKGVDTVNFAKKLLGQIVFLYFLQKKGWFGVGRDDDWGTGSKHFLRELFKKTHGNYSNFFNDILEPLFYEALRIDRSHDDDYYSRFNCKIPFLNGGLFDPIGGYDWVHTDIPLPDELFSNANMTKEGDTGDGILDIFDRYNFTVKEDEPLEKEVAIDPELLGKAYEKFNAIRPDNYDEFRKALKSGEENKFNKKFGVYYTPREIVHYMCQQSLINYLATELDGKASKEDIETLIHIGEHVSEIEARVISEGRETRTYSHKLPESIRKNVALIDQKLEGITVCDPAVGSGAFPVGMMNEIIRARNVLSTFVKEKNRTPYEFKRRCIEYSLYGVDIDPGAVEIAKLRLWLSLVVDEDNIKNIKPLPNLDYKVVCGNSLLGVKKDLFNANLFSELEELKPLFFNETNPSKKQEYKKQIDELISEITSGHTEFDFEVYFSEVFHNNGGFAVVIANPPYLGEDRHKDIFRPIYETEFGKKNHERRMDLFYYFIHKALDVGKIGAEICFITTNYYITADGAKKLRLDLKQRASIRTIINFNELKLFESALGQHNMITFFEKKCNQNDLVETLITKRIGFASSDILKSILSWQDDQTEYFNFFQEELYTGPENYITVYGQRSQIQNILSKIEDQGEPLISYCEINQGIVTGANKVRKKYLEKYNIDAKLNDGIFILTKDELLSKKIRIPNNHIKPWYKNSDIRKYATTSSTNSFILYFKDEKRTQEIEPEILNHFKKFKEILIDRLSVCKKNKFQWNIVSKWINRGEYYLLFYPRKPDIFERPKIVCPQRSKTNVFGYNEIPWYTASDVYLLNEKDNNTDNLKYILGLLNSKLYYAWLYYKGKKKGESLELFKTPLSMIPLKKGRDDEQKKIIQLVNEILSITKTEGYFENLQKQAKGKALEREIDQLVYKLYDLTPEEIKIVEGGV